MAILNLMNRSIQEYIYYLKLIEYKDLLIENYTTSLIKDHQQKLLCFLPSRSIEYLYFENSSISDLKKYLLKGSRFSKNV